MDNYLATAVATKYKQDVRATNCLKHPGKACFVRWQTPVDIPEAERPITFEAAGFPCRPWTFYGAASSMNTGPAHPDMEPFHLWKNTTRVMNHDLVLLENSDKFMPQLLYESFPEKYTIKYVVFSPQDFGWPMRRLRFYAILINLDTMLWVGPSSADLTESMLTTCGRRCSLEGDCFAGLDSKEAIAACKKDLAINRGFFPSLDKAATLPLQDILAPGHADCFVAAQLKLKEGYHKVGLGGSYIIDASQSPNRCRDGPLMPTMTRTSQLVSVSRGHAFTNDEVDFAMGWPTIPMTENALYRDHLTCDFNSFKSNERRSLAGNGMVLPQFATFLFYIMSFTVRRCSFEAWSPALPPPGQESEDDESQRSSP
jgi:hypothetical protein